MSPLVPYTTLFRSARRREFFCLVPPPWRLDAGHLVAAQHEHAEPVLPVSGWRHDPLAADGGRCLPALDPARIRLSRLVRLAVCRRHRRYGGGTAVSGAQESRREVDRKSVG